MNKTTISSFVRALFVVLMMAVALPFVGGTSASALELSDIDIKYEADGIKQDGTAFAKNTDQASAWTNIFLKYKGIIMGISGVATLTMIVLFILNFMKLGQAAGNPQARSSALTGLLWTGIAAAGAGGVTVFVGVFSNILKD